MTTLTAAALEVAKTQIGQEEHPKGSNWGTPVKDYLHSVGIDFPASWCAAFVYWCYERAAAKRLEMVPYAKNPLAKTGGVLRHWNERPGNRITGTPQAGDIFIMDFGKGLGHTGFVKAVDGLNVHTIEGNSNDTGSREGFEVCERVRPISKMKGFLRY